MGEGGGEGTGEAGEEKEGRGRRWRRHGPLEARASERSRASYSLCQRPAAAAPVAPEQICSLEWPHPREFGRPPRTMRLWPSIRAFAGFSGHPLV